MLLFEPERGSDRTLIYLGACARPNLWGFNRPADGMVRPIWPLATLQHRFLGKTCKLDKGPMLFRAPGPMNSHASKGFGELWTAPVTEDPPISLKQSAGASHAYAPAVRSRDLFRPGPLPPGASCRCIAGTKLGSLSPQAARSGKPKASVPSERDEL